MQSFLRSLAIVGIATFTLSACSSSPEPVQSEWPSWYDVRQNDDQYFYGFAEGHSNNANMAARQARLNARGELAESLQTSFEAEAREGGQHNLDDPETYGVFTSAMQERTQTAVTGAEVYQIERVRQDDGSVRVFVGVRMPRNQAELTGRALLDEMDERMQATR
ncbi:hypothetical protein CWE09_05720 [Aliidiomarina minuta]|uniref:Lipoprotein LPP20-like domain-containing protein n=1 Tax=Aliidiomarina minuta TaxID=880057 RepID=A0A432W830_9GAMM|nr:LPP20 family lipoprotein [Aliidiomarina minuta]RUO26212.1 hypothetical protein CWE09_05720 [Aliidiomarina minuta]